MDPRWLLYRELELIPAELAERYAPRPTFLSRLWQGVRWVVEVLSKPPELKVWQECDRAGSIVWRIYDPETGFTSNFSSDAEVLAWIESHYFR